MQARGPREGAHFVQEFMYLRILSHAMAMPIQANDLLPGITDKHLSHIIQTSLDMLIIFAVPSQLIKIWVNYNISQGTFTTIVCLYNQRENLTQ